MQDALPVKPDCRSESSFLCNIDIWIKSVIAIFGLTATLLSGTTVRSQAFCALRDPVAQIYNLFEEANGYRSEVRTVESGTLAKVSERLGYGMHRSEIGRHTVYVATSNDAPLGVVHVRSERSRWGLVEVAWALDQNLKIIDFALQRCRSSKCDDLTDMKFKKQILGLGINELIPMLTPDGQHLAPGRIQIRKKSRDLAAVLLRNGLKTIAVTHIAWSDVLGKVPVASSQMTSSPGPASQSPEEQ